ncbi:MAG: hypothetical protein ABIJ56_13280 [Pseudomonadota bacterium]
MTFAFASGGGGQARTMLTTPESVAPADFDQGAAVTGESMQALIPEVGKLPRKMAVGTTSAVGAAPSAAAAADLETACEGGSARACLLYCVKFKQVDSIDASKMRNLGMKRSKECSQGMEAGCPKTMIEP